MQVPRIPKEKFYLKLLQIEKDIRELKELLEDAPKQSRRRVSLRGICGKVKISNRDLKEAKKSLFPYEGSKRF